ncbi:MAG: hypothetical protein RI973_1417 [Bacteroidota bacterium]|jgi:two-component system LytT family response regulator
MFKSVIVEDEPHSQQLLQSKIKSYFPEITVSAVIDNKSEAIDYLNKNKVDLLFLDNHLKGGLGLDVVKQTSLLELEVIYITAYTNYAVEALNNGATYYLLKPFSNEDFKAAVNRAIQKIASKKQVLIIGIGDDKFLRLDEIHYIVSQGAYTLFHLGPNGTALSSRNLGYYESRLPKESFYRIHHSCIVNINQIERVERGASPRVILKFERTELEISTRKSRDFFSTLKQLA